jgi:hypothetical protein
MKITIHNLTHKQKALLDVMWELDSLDSVRAFIRSLPPKDCLDASSLMTIVEQEVWETEPGRMELYADYAEAVIRSAARK